MTVEDMRALLLAAKQFAEAANISGSATNKLTDVTEALGPFGTMDISTFATLLRQAEEYKRTGVLPAPAKPTKNPSKRSGTSSVNSAERVEQLVKQLNDLYAVVDQNSVGFGAIDEICDAVGRLGKAQVLKIAEGFDIRTQSKTTKAQAVDEIKRKLTEQKGSAERIRPIGEN